MHFQKNYDFFPRKQIQKGADFFTLKNEIPPWMSGGGRFARILKSRLVVVKRGTAVA